MSDNESVAKNWRDGHWEHCVSVLLGKDENQYQNILSSNQMLLYPIFSAMVHMVTPGYIFRPYYGAIYKNTRLERLKEIARLMVEGLSSEKYSDTKKALTSVYKYIKGRGSELDSFESATVSAYGAVAVCVAASVIGLGYFSMLFAGIPLAADSAYINQRYYEDCLWLQLHQAFLPKTIEDGAALDDTRLLKGQPEAPQYIARLQDPEEKQPLPRYICSNKINSDLRCIRSRNRLKAAMTLGAFVVVASVLLSNPITATAVGAYVLYAACGYLMASDVVDRCSPKYPSLRGVAGSLFRGAEAVDGCKQVSSKGVTAL